jgi:hypothetical protein
MSRSATRFRRALEICFVHAGRDPAAKDSPSMAIRTENRAAGRLWIVQRYNPGRCCRHDRDEPAVCADVSRWSPRNCGRNCDRARSSKQCSRFNDCSQSEVQVRLCTRTAIVPIGAIKPASCLPPVAITAVPNGERDPLYFMQWSFGIEHQLGTTASVQAQYVGTRAVNQPYLTQVNGYQIGVPRIFRAVPLWTADRSSFWCRHPVLERSERSLSGSAIHGDEAPESRDQGQVNYT